MKKISILPCFVTSFSWSVMNAFEKKIDIRRIHQIGFIDKNVNILTVSLGLKHLFSGKHL